MTDIRFIHKNSGEVLAIEIDGTAYTPEQIRAALAAVSRAWDIAHERRGTAASKIGRIIEALRPAVTDASSAGRG